MSAIKEVTAKKKTAAKPRSKPTAKKKTAAKPKVKPTPFKLVDGDVDLTGIFLGPDGKFYRSLSHDGFEASIEVKDLFETTPPKKGYCGPLIAFQGREDVVVSDKETITLAGWNEVKSWFYTVNERDTSECQVTIYRSPDNSTMLMYPHDQYEKTGMTTKEVEDSPNTAARSTALEAAGWVEWGTIHHHCTSTAFASGVDTDDESKKRGVHITLGNMKSTQLDVHVRARFIKTATFTQDDKGEVIPDGEAINKLYDKLDITAWVDEPPYLDTEKFPSFLDVKDVLKKAILVNIKEEDFPEAWMKNLVEKKNKKVFGTDTTKGSSTGQQVYQRGSGGSSSVSSHAQKGCGTALVPVNTSPELRIAAGACKLTKAEKERIHEYKDFNEALMSESKLEGVRIRDLWDYFFVRCGWNPFRFTLERWDDVVVECFKVFPDATMEDYHNVFDIYVMQGDKKK